MRWIVSLAAVLIGFAIAFTTKSPGTLGLGLLIGFAGLFGCMFALVAARIATTAQPEVSMTVDPKIRELHAKARQAKADAAAKDATAKIVADKPQ